MAASKQSASEVLNSASQLKNLRSKLEAELLPQLPIAFSMDGKSFEYETALSTVLVLGSYVVLDTKSGTKYLGQIISQVVSLKDGPEYGVGLSADMNAFVAKMSSTAQLVDRVKIRYIQGTGILLARLNKEQFVQTDTTDIFQDATVLTANEELVNDFFLYTTEKDAALEIGTPLYTSSKTRVLLKAGGFDRHTFLCGQSGSGKTFSLGILIEQLLLETNLRILVLDPNSDFVNLNKLRRITEINKTRTLDLSPKRYDEIDEQYSTIHTSIIRPEHITGDIASALRIRFSDLNPFEQAAVFQLDPLENREEFNSFWRVIDSLGQDKYSISDIQNAISTNFSTEARQVGLRIQNLGIADWEIWCGDNDISILDTLSQKDWRCLVIDTGTLSSLSEKSVVAGAILDNFWQHRETKEPVLLVIDEAHNICPQHPSSNLEIISTNHAIRIAGEGRKYGLYLLLASQRPEKIHSNVVSQCDNLVLMKMNSRSDLSYVAQTFSQVPPSLVELSTSFKLGEGLIAGKFVSSPTLVKFEGRLSAEGGNDVPGTWAKRKT